MKNLRPSDLAREHDISTQAVRNYERDGFIPPAQRTSSGYRVYTETHAAALRAYLAVVQAYGYAVGGDIMRALGDSDLNTALAAIDRGHAQLLRDRSTLDTVERAVGDLSPAPDQEAGRDLHQTELRRSLSIGDLARRLGVTAATLRNWEATGILAPARNSKTGHRVFSASDVRDADLTHLLRRGGYSLEHIRTVVQQVRTAGGTDALSASLQNWRQRLTARGVAMLHAAISLSRYVELSGPTPART